MSTGEAPMLEVRGLVMEYPAGAFGARPATRAVRDVSFAIAPGETLALVGESGSGKTSVGRCILRLVEPTAGSITFAGTELVGASRPALRAMRREVQAVFQESLAALNPRMRMAEIVAEGMVVHGIGTARDRAERVAALFAEVGLDPALGRRRPHECSGGQRQRVAIARALAVEPRLLVLDEPVTALDVSVQAQVLNLLAALQASRGMGYLFIAHDLAVVRYLAHRTAVMYRGEIVEAGRTEGVLSAPAHPYTQALRAAVPVPDPAAVRTPPQRPRPGAGETGGCPYRAACQHPARDERCRHEPPALLPLGSREVACHHA